LEGSCRGLIDIWYLAGGAEEKARQTLSHDDSLCPERDSNLPSFTATITTSSLSQLIECTTDHQNLILQDSF
jgi:hypothetical protein